MFSTTSGVSTTPSGQLDLPGTSSRLVGLLRERQKLLAKVAAKKSKLDALVDQVEDRKTQAARLSATLEPLRAQAETIDREIHTLFAALLSRKGLKRKDQLVIRDVHDMLKLEGIISAPPNDALDTDDGFAPQAGGHAGSAPPPPGPDSESPSAKRPAGAKAAAIRELFRRLASAVHPDKAMDSCSQQVRTEAMKEVTRAYQEGDLARLLELEKTWLAGDVAEASDDEDDTERRCANLESTNRELKDQLGALDKRLRELRQLASSDLMAALGFAPQPGGSPCADVEAVFGQQLETLRQVRDFVQSFADGKITINQLAAGPGIDSSSDLADELLLETLGEILSAPLHPSGSAGPRPRSARRRRRKYA